MAPFAAQPEGTGRFLRTAVLLDGSFSRLNFASRALPCAKNGSVAAVPKRQQTLAPVFQP
ncbi:MAG: hypothetical protein E6Q69_06290 [Aquipseudomonas alcaligenes]|uniref:Uncharacterized protein n=1 Tax=Aquipseudomonas alcaligenes TaxID=43263 RepID=A0A5C7W6C7_AQUAC|nr:MAG: hypothetical protein E6Q69_06290 [Pseudomonas alcaligenes]